MTDGYFVKKIEKKLKGKYEVSLEGGEPLVLYGKELASYHVEAEQYLDVLTYERILKEVLNKRAAKRVMFLLQQQDRSEKNLRDLLRKNGYPLASIDYAIEYVKKYHYLDDKRLAENYIRFRQETQSRQEIKQKLLQKGVSLTDVETALELGYEADENVQIQRLLQKRKYDAKTADLKEKQRMYGYLMRRGFSSSEINRALRNFEDE